MTQESDNFIDHLRALVTTSHELLAIAHGVFTPENLHVPNKDDGVEEARKILRWLKNLQGTQQDMEQWMRLGQLPEQRAKADMLKRLITIYAGQLKIAALHNPTILSHYLIESANLATGSLTLSIALHTLDVLPSDNNQQTNALDKALESTPESWERRQPQSVEQLIESIETALAHLTNKPIGDRSPIDRLVEISDQITQTAKKLRSIDTLEPPAREESIELAREILRRLKGLVFSNKPVEEAIDTGKPSEKLFFAQKMHELISIYKNLLSEAAQFNPNIMNNERIRKANEAVGKFAHTIKLLAAKELPNSIASTMQISADVSQMPEEWKGLEGRTIDRLLHSMEDGLESAVNDIIAQQQEQQDQQDQDIQQATTELIDSHSSHHRRRRRRRHSSASGLGKSAARRNANDIDGDGVRDILQGKGGAFNQLNLEEIARLGNTLRTLNNQAANLAPAPTTNNTASKISAGDTISPDDKSFAERAADKTTNPRNRNKPQIG